MAIRIITEIDIIAARQRVAAAEAANEQMSFEDGLLGSAGLTPDMVREWLGARVHVNWCACPGADRSLIVCPSCGLPVWWPDETGED